MATRHRISCIGKSDFLNHHQRLKRIGGVNPDGSRWHLTEAEAVAALEAGRWRFYIVHDGRERDIVVALSRYGRKYLKTAADGLQPESLLTLPECR